jgi:hypothetical protein
MKDNGMRLAQRQNERREFWYSARPSGTMKLGTIRLGIMRLAVANTFFFRQIKTNLLREPLKVVLTSHMAELYEGVSRGSHAAFDHRRWLDGSWS